MPTEDSTFVAASTAAYAFLSVPKGNGIKFMTQNCPICTDKSVYFDEAQVLGKYLAVFSRCTSCGLVFANDPYWLNEAYVSVYADADLGAANRSISNAATATALIRMLRLGKRPGLDFGGGSGLFVRLMRDRGFDFWLREPYAENQFANGFEASDAMADYVLTSFEVLEHLRDPHEALGPTLRAARLAVFSTQLLPDPPPQLTSWWYYQLDSGQHITLWTRQALCRFAATYGFRITSTMNLHVMSKSRVPKFALRALSSGRLSKLVNLWPSRRSLLPLDFEARFGVRPDQ